MEPVKVVALSANAKVGKVAATYVGTNSCPKSCPLKGNGCYYETGLFTRKINQQLNDASAGMSVNMLAAREAKAIDATLPKDAKGRALRLHVGGDARTNGAAMMLAGAADRWLDRNGGPVWTYTHAWRNVDRDSWGRVSVLASGESAHDAQHAWEMGYAPAIVVPKFESKKAFKLGDTTLIPCPAQTHDDIKCTDCKLCWNADALQARKAGIAFEAHGSQRKRALKVIG